MGRPKALLDTGAGTFLERAVRSLMDGGCEHITAVVPDGSDLVEGALSTGAVAALNGDPASEQIDSLRIGLMALPGEATAALVLPVDHPVIRAATIETLMAAHRMRPEAVLRPRHRGAPGHPTLFPRSMWRMLFERELERGARSLVESGDVEVLDVDVEDPGTVADIDTPREYERWIGGT